MQNVLIVDDEPMIREGLRTLIDWEEHGYSVIGIAKNGKEGYEKYQQLKPDLIISDIKMPEMDGLTLIEKVRKENKGVHFIILSGYADFDYAKRAISCGANAYLLKPLDEEELIEKLKQMKTVKQNKQRVNTDEMWKELLDPAYGQKSVEEVLFECEEKGIEFKPVRLLVVKPDRSFRKWMQHAASLRSIQGVKSVFPFGDLFVVILSSKQHVSSFFHVIKEKEPFSFHTAISEVVHQLWNLSVIYKQMCEQLNHSFYYPEGTILKMNTETQPNKSIPYVFDPDSFSDRFYLALSVANYKKCEDLVNELMIELAARRWEEQHVKKICAYIFTHTMSKLIAIDPRKQAVLLPISMKTPVFYEAASLQEMDLFFKQLFQEVIHIFDDGTPDSQMEKMIDLIHTQYNQNLKLEKLASVFNYNSAYLGKLFKSYTGEYFNTYLDKVRVEKGKELLKQGYKVYEVAEQIGYANVDYFHRKFKRHAGISPTVYRNSHK